MEETIDLQWLAGWLEGEGCFTPANGYPRITGSSTDEDVIVEVARILGAKVDGPRYYKGKVGQPLKALWRVNVHGEKSFIWMKKLYPLMRGSRRKNKIAEMLSMFKVVYPNA